MCVAFRNVFEWTINFDIIKLCFIIFLPKTFVFLATGFYGNNNSTFHPFDQNLIWNYFLFRPHVFNQIQRNILPINYSPKHDEKFKYKFIRKQVLLSTVKLMIFYLRLLLFPWGSNRESCFEFTQVKTFSPPVSLVVHLWLINFLESIKYLSQVGIFS